MLTTMVRLGDFIPRSIWTLIEANMGIICACLPILKGPLVRLFPRVFQGTTSKSNREYRPDGGDSYALHEHPRKRTGESGAGISNSSDPGSSMRCRHETMGPWAGSEERIIGSMGKEINDGGSMDRIMKKTDVTIAYERTQSGK